MPDDTTILSLPLILPAQAQKHVTHNEALVALDLIVQLTVINRTLTTAPALPALGDRHIVAAGATGAFAGQAGRIAHFGDTGWQFTQALPGWRAHVLAEGQTAVFDGLIWKTVSEAPLSVPQLGVAATADATNRLTVAAPATLLNHAGAGHQLKLNKAAAADTASLLFQTGFSGRAEMGTAGTDAFGVKVSADGSAWWQALLIAPATGEVTLPAPLRLGGQAADPASPANGAFWLNTTTGEVKVRSAGLTLPLGGGGGVSDGDKGDITVSASGTVWTVDPGAITLAKLVSIPTDSFLGRDTAGTGVPEVMTATQVRTILNVASGATANATDAALRDRTTHTGTQTATSISDFAEAVDDRVAALLVAGPNVTLTYNDSGNALTIAAAGGGGGAPGGVAGEIQFNNAGAFAGAADVEIEGGQLRLPSIATPSAPVAGGVKLFGRSVAGRLLPAIIGPSGLDTSLQPHIGRNKLGYVLPNGNSTTLSQLGLSLTGVGTATAKNWASTTRYTKMRGLEYLVTVAAVTAIAGWRGAAQQFTVGSNAAGDGGFHHVCRWGPATGVATATSRAFVGMVASTAAQTDAEPSVRTNHIGMGWDASDTNIQFMHNDGSGISTKIDLGASFPVPTTDRSEVYEIAMFSPPGTTQSVSYEITNLNSGAVATGTVTTDMPGTTTALNPYGQCSVGGTSSVIGICLFSLYIETDY